MDNLFIGRLWRSLKDECFLPHAFETTPEPRVGWLLLNGRVEIYILRKVELNDQTEDDVKGD
jgi:hypothetical protein